MAKQKNYMVSDNLSGFDIHYAKTANFEASFRRWIVRQIDEGEMTAEQARDRFNINPKEYKRIIASWQNKYSEQYLLSLKAMTSKERAKLKELQKRLKKTEDALEEEKLRSLLYSNLIDVAEDMFKIKIRKKPGPKQ